jgi:uncharacterized membrane protein YgcG
MGVTGLSQWARVALAQAFVPAPREAEHVHVDVNSLVHESIRHARNDDGVFAALGHRLDALVAADARPTVSLVLALDGPAPLCKLATQRQRRLARVRGGSLHPGPSSLAITPGTPFMAKCDGALVSWAAHALAQGRLQRGVVVVVDPSSRAGEGETKLHRRLGALPARARCDDVHVVIGGDSDLLLLALCCDARRLFVVDTAATPSGMPQRAKGGRPPLLAFSCEIGRALLSRLGRDVLSPPGGARVGPLDLVLLSALQGCDYTPRLRGYSLHRAYEALANGATAGAPLVGRAADGRACVRADALARMLRAAFGDTGGGGSGAAEAEVDEDGGYAEPSAAAAAGGGVLGYVAVALWAVEQARDAAPPHWYHAWPLGQETPHVADLLAMAGEAVEAARAPRDPRPPLPPAACALAMLPAAAARLLPAPLQALLAPSGSLGALFEAERCAACATHRQRLGALAATLDAMRAAAAAPGAGAAEAAAEACVRAAIAPASRDYLQHRTLHATLSAEAMADAVARAVARVPLGAFAGEAAPCAHGGVALELHARADGCGARGCGWATPRAQGRLARAPPAGVCCIELAEADEGEGAARPTLVGSAVRPPSAAPPPARSAWLPTAPPTPTPAAPPTPTPTAPLPTRLPPPPAGWQQQARPAARPAAATAPAAAGAVAAAAAADASACWPPATGAPQGGRPPRRRGRGGRGGRGAGRRGGGGGGGGGVGGGGVGGVGGGDHPM